MTMDWTTDQFVMSDPLTPRRRSKRGRTEEDPSSPSQANGVEEPVTPSSTRSSARKTRTSQDETTSPPAKGPRIDSSPGGDLEPLPSSPQSGGVSQERSLFSSPPQSRLGAPTSEIDLSSPLNYGTPSSRTGGPLTPGAAATPIRSRPDVRSDRKIRQVTIGGSDPSVRFQ
uniref:DNA replication licensing factor mcm4-B n=1 Tax=Magallana gigas TaxID=29159 RepID=K1QXH7_MAGGI